MEGLVEHFEQFFQEYGYWAMFLLLLLENAGFPVPGETSLLYASFLAYQGKQLQLPQIILIGILACIIGDGTGYWLGRKGGHRVARILRLTPPRLAFFRSFFDRYGPWTVFFARFIAGLRIIGGPAAGMCGMSWPRFLLFNSLGAIVWVTVIATVGYTLGSSWQLIVHWIKRFNLVFGTLAALVLLWLIWRHRRKSQKAENSPEVITSDDTRR